MLTYTSAIIIRLTIIVKTKIDVHASQSGLTSIFWFVTHNDAEVWVRKRLLLTSFYRWTNWEPENVDDLNRLSSLHISCTFHYTPWPLHSRVNSQSEPYTEYSLKIQSLEQKKNGKHSSMDLKIIYEFKTVQSISDIKQNSGLPGIVWGWN